MAENSRPRTLDLLDFEVFQTKHLSYHLSTPFRGKALIINNVHFKCQAGSECEPRVGALNDGRNLTAALGSLGFEVDYRVDLSGAQLTDSIAYTVRRLNSGPEQDVFLCAIMSHGGGGACDVTHGCVDECGEDMVYTVQWEPVRLNAIVRRFDNAACPGMAGKPKIFIVQACRGEQEATGRTCWERVQSVEHPPTLDGQDAVCYPDRRMPPRVFSCDVTRLSDILVAKSTSCGYKSYRSDKGSWFITSLVYRLLEPASRDIHSTLVLAHNDTLCNRTQGSGFRQSPQFRSSLRRLLHLNQLALANHSSGEGTECGCLFCGLGVRLKERTCIEGSVQVCTNAHSPVERKPRGASLRRHRSNSVDTLCSH